MEKSLHFFSSWSTRSYATWVGPRCGAPDGAEVSMTGSMLVILRAVASVRTSVESFRGAAPLRLLLGVFAADDGVLVASLDPGAPGSSVCV